MTLTCNRQCGSCSYRGTCASDANQWSPPRTYPCGVTPPPVECDPYHIPGGPKDVTPAIRTYPMPPMEPLPGIWGARLPAYETYRPWSQGPNAIVGQTYNMTLADVIAAYPNFDDLALADYPIWDDTKRSWLNERIHEHFWLREIRGETPANFIRFIHRHMDEGMPPINVIFASLEDLTPDKLRSDNDYTSDTTNDGESSGTTKASSETQAVSSSNPLQSVVLQPESNYYDQGSKTDGSSTTTTTGTNKGSASTHTHGYNSRSLSSTITEWATGVNNALLLVFAELEPCFSQIWNDHSNDLY